MASSTEAHASKGFLGSQDDILLPAPFDTIPRTPLTFGPSPIQFLSRMTEDLGGQVKIYAKRDDCNSGYAFGGNKTRKLEYLVADALAQGCDTLVSIGGVQSNHTRQVAAVAAATGLKCALVQEHWVDWPDPAYAKVGNIQLSRLMGADARLDPSAFGIGHKDTLKKLTAEVVAAGGKPYYIPAGASDHPLGGLGYARWAFEVEAQEAARGVFFDTVVVCAVTGSTMAGMVAGFKLAAARSGSRPRRILGVDASARPRETFDQVLRIARFTAARIGLAEGDVAAEDVELNADYHGGCYGVPDARTKEAMEYGARVEAFITDPVYEGKTLAGMIDLIRKGEIRPESTVLFAHLGGQLALNGYSSM